MALASTSSKRLGGLLDSGIRALAAISRFDGERILLNRKQLVAVGCTGRYSVERVADVVVKKRIAANRPAAGKFRNEFSAISHFAVEGAVPVENVMTRLDLVRVTPFARERALSARLDNRTGRHQKKRERKHSFHAREGETVRGLFGKRNRRPHSFDGPAPVPIGALPKE